MTRATLYAMLFTLGVTVGAACVSAAAQAHAAAVVATAGRQPCSAP